MRLILLILLCWSTALLANDLVIVNRPYSETDKRDAYAYELLLLALQKTIPQYGQYELRMTNLRLPTASLASAPAITNSNDRLLFEIKRAEIVNVAIVVTREQWEKEALPIRIPIDMGLMSYRLLMIREQDQQQFSQIHTLEQLKSLRTGVGETWSNYRVLQHHQFSVVPTNSYDGQFRMLLAKRFDYITRGTHEAFSEVDTYREQFAGMAVERDLLLYMPLPMYFFVSPSQPRLAQRIESGLRIMLRDGSFQEVIKRHLGPLITRARFCERRIFRIDNPFLSQETPLTNQELWFDPWRAPPGAKALCTRTKMAHKQRP